MYVPSRVRQYPVCVNNVNSDAPASDFRTVCVVIASVNAQNVLGFNSVRGRCVISRSLLSSLLAYARL